MSIRSEDEREECVDYSEGDEGQRKENGGGETRGFEVVLWPANHWMLGQRQTQMGNSDQIRGVDCDNEGEEQFDE